MLKDNKIPSYKMVRELPSGAKVVKVVNGIPIYNMNVFQNIMSWNRQNPSTPALDYFGSQITYGQLPNHVDIYAKGFEKLGIKKDSIVTLSLPVSNEYILSLFATTSMGAISNNVNFLFLRSDLARYTLEKNSDTLFILDVYLPLIARQLKNSGVKKVIVTSLSDYLPEDKKDYFSDLNKLPKKVREVLLDANEMTECMSIIKSLRDVEFINMSEVLKEGEKEKTPILYPEVDIEKDSIYSYTSGTTGIPKCIVFKEQSPNAIIEMHNGLDLGEYVGDRSLLLIPPSHATGMYYATYLQMAKGKTMVLQPMYDKNEFARNLRDYKINHTLAPASFYLAGVAGGDLGPAAFEELRRACSGGEPISKSNVISINNWLKNNGSPEGIAIGGGAGEVGSSALTSYELDPKIKTNETGKPIPGVFVKIVDENGIPVKKGQRGIIHISSAAAADRYLDNEKVTSEYFYYDEKGIRYGNLGDIAVQNEDDSYNMLGRGSDSYVDKDGKVIYLFDTEYALSIDDPVIEWEITSFQKEKGEYLKVAQVILKPEFIGKETEAIKYLCQKYDIEGVKIYDEFEVSEVTGKRDYQLLKSDKKGYYYPYDNKSMIRIDFDGDNTKRQLVTYEEINTSIKRKQLKI